MGELAISTLSPLLKILVPILVYQISGTNRNKGIPGSLIRKIIIHHEQEQVTPVHDQVYSLATRIQMIIHKSATALCVDHL
jgi:hypothetical protein